LGVLVLVFVPRPRGLVEIYGCIANFALGFSCFHVLAVNLSLLPRELQPRMFIRGALALSGTYFFALAAMTLAAEIHSGNRTLGYGTALLMTALLMVLAFYMSHAIRRGVHLK
jgi:hypothetical protein